MAYRLSTGGIVGAGWEAKICFICSLAGEAAGAAKGSTVSVFTTFDGSTVDGTATW
jgi:hypothetical protein